VSVPLATEEVPDPTIPEPAGDPAGRSPALTAFRYLAMPVFVLGSLGLLLLWIGGLELDSIEQRQLRFDVIWPQVVRHVQLSAISTGIVIGLAVPVGIIATRPRFRRVTPYVIGLGNAGQAIPSLGLLGLIFLLARTTDLLPSTGTVPAVAALVAYSFLPILRNTMVGLQQVDSAVLEAGRGMGMSNGLVLRKLELPLSVPVILAGVRTALIINVGTATIVFLLGGGGLGRIIFQGFQVQRLSLLVTGAVLVAVLALLVDHVAGIVEERLTPKGL
jgi:osmoprotectant transport system permease protein